VFFSEHTVQISTTAVEGNGEIYCTAVRTTYCTRQKIYSRNPHIKFSFFYKTLNIDTTATPRYHFLTVPELISTAIPRVPRF